MDRPIESNGKKSLATGRFRRGDPLILYEKSVIKADGPKELDDRMFVVEILRLSRRIAAAHESAAIFVNTNYTSLLRILVGFLVEISKDFLLGRSLFKPVFYILNGSDNLVTGPAVRF